MIARGLRLCLLAGLTMLSGCALFGGRPAGPDVAGTPLHKLNVHTTTVSMRVEAVDRTLKKIVRQEIGKAAGAATARKSLEDAVAHHRAAESVAASLPRRPGVRLEAARKLVKLEDAHLTGIGNTLARYGPGKGDLAPVQLAAARYLHDYWQSMAARNRNIAAVENKDHPPTAQSYFNMASFQMAEMMEGIWKQRVALLEGGDPGAAFMAAHRHADDLNLKIQDSIAMGGRLADQEIADASAGHKADEKLDPAAAQRIAEARRYKAALVQHTVAKALLANVIGVIYDKEEDWMKPLSMWNAEQQIQAWQAIDALRKHRLEFQSAAEEAAHPKTAAAQ